MFFRSRGESSLGFESDYTPPMSAVASLTMHLLSAAKGSVSTRLFVMKSFS